MAEADAAGTFGATMGNANDARRDAGRDARQISAGALPPHVPTLRWVNGSQVNNLYVDGMDTAASWRPPGCSWTCTRAALSCPSG